MVDLHMHTTHSDGTWDTKKMLEEAQKANLDYISITDHNSVRAYYDMKDMDVQNIYTGKIITGCEFSCYFNEAKIELLGYNIDFEETNKWVKENYDHKSYSFQEEFKKLIYACKKHNIKLTENLTYDRKNGYPYDIVYNDILKYPENVQYFSKEELSSPNNFFRSATCNLNNPLHIEFEKNPEAKEVSDFIRNVGGKVFIAHIYVYQFNDPVGILKELIDNNIIDGIEVYHTDHTEENVNTLLKICEENKLLISAGSDCHGDKRKDRKVGKIFNGKAISDKAINELLKNI